MCCLGPYLPPCNDYTYVCRDECGHQLPVFCGKKAPANCIKCDTGVYPAIPVINLPCGHDIELDYLDGNAEISNVRNPEETNKESDGSICTDKLEKFTCPECGKPVREEQTGIPKLAEVADKLITKMGQSMGMLGKQLTYHEIMLRNSFPLLQQGLRSSPLGYAANQQLISERFRGLTEVQDHITEVRGIVALPNRGLW